jgi:hypothetical protein
MERKIRDKEYRRDVQDRSSPYFIYLRMFRSCRLAFKLMNSAKISSSHTYYSTENSLWIIEDMAFSLSFDLAPFFPLFPLPPLPSVSSTSDTQED